MKAPGLPPHLDRSDWLTTSAGDPRGYIDAAGLRELWFHTGSNCNLRCWFCLEGSKPGDDRIQALTFDDARPFLDEAVTLGVEQFSFTGGEPFVIEDFIRILDHALTLRPCLVLTNGTEPLLNQLYEVLALGRREHALRFRVSLDHPDPARHDEARGKGNFRKTLDCMKRLHDAGSAVSVARRMDKDEDEAAVRAAFADWFERAGLPRDLGLHGFPEFLTPHSAANVPEITEDCMTRHHSPASRAAFMCGYTRFVLKKKGRMRVYACTLVDDDEDYDLGGTLRESLRHRVMLKHHRCYSCFAYGATCSGG